MTPKIFQDPIDDTGDGTTTLMSETSLLSFTLTHEKSYVRKFLMKCISVVTRNTADTMEEVVFNGALSHARLLRLDSSRSTHLPQPLRVGTRPAPSSTVGSRPASASTGPDVNHLSGTQLINIISSSRKFLSFPLG